MPPTDNVLRAWWPTTQAMDLVAGPIERVAETVKTEVTRFAGGDPVEAGWRRFDSLDAAFSWPPSFANIATHFLVLPTRSEWIVIWYNDFMCAGYYALCACLTMNHGLTTIHWSAHDAWTTEQAGARFHHRRDEGGKMIERLVQVAQTDRRWDFFAEGPLLAEEDVALYRAGKKRDRLNERHLIDLLARLGARPWEAAFYALPEAPVFTVSRPAAPTIIKRARPEVLLPAA